MVKVPKVQNWKRVAGYYSLIMFFSGVTYAGSQFPIGAAGSADRSGANDPFAEIARLRDQQLAAVSHSAASVEELHGLIASQADRIKQLEAAVVRLSTNRNPAPEPLAGAAVMQAERIERLEERLARYAEQRPAAPGPRLITPPAAPAKPSYFSQAVQDADQARYQADGKIVFSYEDAGLYRIYGKPGQVTDIRLHPGEKVTYIGGGSTALWKVDTAVTGEGAGLVSHVYVKPVRLGADTNLIINTSRRSYQLQLVAADRYNPIVSWSYPAVGGIEKEPPAEAVPTISMAVDSTENLNHRYQWEKSEYPWSPALVFDDGAKTFIRFAADLKGTRVPMLFIREQKQLIPISFRLQDNTYIVNKLFDEAELHGPDNEVVHIRRQ